MALLESELGRGWVEFVCPKHGFLVATFPTSGVSCRCGSAARRFLNGTWLKWRDVERMRRLVQKSLQNGGSIFVEGPVGAREAGDGSWVAPAVSRAERGVGGSGAA